MDYKYLSTTTRRTKPQNPKQLTYLLIVGAGMAGLFVLLLLIQYFDNSDNVTNASETVSETLSLPSKTSQRPALFKKVNWHHIVVKSGDALSTIFDKLGINYQQLTDLLDVKEAKRALEQLQPGDKIYFEINNEKELQRLRYQMSLTQSLLVTRIASGAFKAETITFPIQTQVKYTAETIKHSLFVAGQRAKLPPRLIYQMAEIFGWDVDFAKDIREGDSFRVLYEDKFVNGKPIDRGDIISAEFINRGTVYRAVRFTDDSGHSRYYTPDGQNMRKAFIRSPVKFSRISSRFTRGRHHPILHRMRAHLGVDYAAPTGTPIRAAGDGKIIHAGNKGGYGKAVIIQHGQKYSTLYGHMSRFASHLRAGNRVQQGQIIGYVGQSGLATGPHLHYEFRVYGVHHNPLTVKLPVTQPIADKYKQQFANEARKLLAMLDSHSHGPSI